MSRSAVGSVIHMVGQVETKACGVGKPEILKARCKGPTAPFSLTISLRIIVAPFWRRSTREVHSGKSIPILVQTGCLLSNLRIKYYRAYRLRATPLFPRRFMWALADAAETKLVLIGMVSRL